MRGRQETAEEAAEAEARLPSCRTAARTAHSLQSEGAGVQREGGNKGSEARKKENEERRKEEGGKEGWKQRRKG